MKAFLSKSVKAMALVIALVALGVLLCSCSDVDNEEGETTEMATDAITTETKQDIVLFADGEYKCAFVYPSLAENEVTEIRNEIRVAFKDKTGISAPFKSDDDSEPDSNTVEVLLGKTNRPESAAPADVTEGTDAYYTVAIVGNKVVINGSDPHQLSLAVKYFTEAYLTGEKTDVLTVDGDMFEQKILKDYSRDYWYLYGVPAYPTGNNKLAPNTYNSGTTIKNFSSGGNNDTSTIVELIQKTNAEEFAAYLAKLEANGYKKEYENEIENNLYAVYYNGEHRLHLSFNPTPAEARVVLDPKGMSIEEFGYSYTPKAGEESMFYQYAIPMTDGEGNGLNCGMLYIIKCADNSVIIIDGGDRSGSAANSDQMTDTALAGLDAFLREITGTKSGEKVRISAWYVTHYHNDHTYGFYHFLEQYNAGYSLERIIANIPEINTNSKWNTQWYYKIITQLNTIINAKYPECKELKVHAGDEIQIADVKLQVLFTHEDLLTANGMFNSEDSNDTSTVIRIDSGKLSMMVLGDANTRTSQRIRRCFTTETLKSDIITAAHHMLNHLPNMYDAVDPEIFYISTSKVLLNSDSVLSGTSYKQRFEYIYNLVGDNYYCAGNETVGFSSISDGLTPDYYKDGVIK